MHFSLKIPLTPVSPAVSLLTTSKNTSENEDKWDGSYPFFASSSKCSLIRVNEQLSSHTRLVYVVMGCLCNRFQSQLKPKEKNCQAAAGALQTNHDIWWKFKLTYVRAGNKETAGKYDSCYP